MNAAHSAASLLLAALVLLADSARAQNADLAITLTASRLVDLRIGEEILVSTAIFNHGPGPATAVSVSAGLAEELFPFDLIGSESPECGPIDELEPDPPPQYFFFWMVDSIPAGGVVTCTARLRVARLPDGLSSSIHAFAQPSSSTPDPDMSDNFAQLTLDFASARQPNMIPGGSPWTLAAIGLGILLGATQLLPRR